MELKFSKQAKKFLHKLSKSDYDRILASIYKLPKGDVVKLQGTGGFRLRVGNFRILFTKDGQILDITFVDRCIKDKN